MKKRYNITILFALLVACNANVANLRPHGSQTNTPELTRNNYLMGFLNEYRSSYDVTYYDINIDFDQKIRTGGAFGLFVQKISI